MKATKHQAKFLNVLLWCHTCWICENAVEDTLSATSLSTWSKPDDEVTETVRLRTGAGFAGTEAVTPELVVSAEVEEVGIVKQVDRRPSNKLATSCIYKR